MKNLLRADLYRLCRSRITWLLMLLCAALGVYGGIMLQKCADPSVRIDAGDIFICLTCLITLCVLFHLLAEKNDGTLRNQIAAGFTRAQIFLSHMVLALALSAVMLTLTLVPLLLLARESLAVLFRGLAFPLLPALYLTNMVYAAFAIVCSMPIRTRGAGEMLCLILLTAMALFWDMCHAALSEPECFEELGTHRVPITEAEFEAELANAANVEQYEGDLGSYTAYVVELGEAEHIAYTRAPDKDGGFFCYKDETRFERTPNPFYVGQPLRTVYTIYFDAMPARLTILCADYVTNMAKHLRDDRTERPLLDYDACLMLYLLGELALLTGAGLLIFRKLDLK